ncbi:MAG: DUF4912 domain-containing protein [Clostridia bacterium]|nr:DUF4912 domain-containing protein [Clostridia bacterium]
MLQVILDLRRQGLSYRRIAEELGISVGRVKFRLKKYIRQLLDTSKRTRPINKQLFSFDGNLESTVFSNGYKVNEKKADKIKDVLKKFNNSVETEWRDFKGFAIPQGYRENRLVILPKDPYSIFGYWELTEDSRNITTAHYQRPWEDLILAARIYDLTGVLHFDGFNALWREHIMHPMTNNWYFEQLVPGHHYCVEIGVKSDMGAFLPMVRSNTVTTPRDTAGAIRLRGQHQQQGWSVTSLQEKDLIEHLSSYSWFRS